jgi:hypothetical protein
MKNLYLKKHTDNRFYERVHDKYLFFELFTWPNTNGAGQTRKENPANPAWEGLLQAGDGFAIDPLMIRKLRSLKLYIY